ncbi:MAG TPA: hypothetical protein VD837_00485 [Terriglobales bacterium]|nr:hypothetical protein [Terriglobales bacterium]
MTSRDEISIWFFIGISLAVNGGLILGAGLYEWFIQPPQNPVVLYDLHAGVWWGAVLLAVGLIYCVRFKPVSAKKAAIEAEKHEEIHVS